MYAILAGTLACLAVLSSCRSGAAQPAKVVPTASRTFAGSVLLNGAVSRAVPVTVKTRLTNTVRNHIKFQTAVPEFSGYSGAETLNRQIAQQTKNGEAELEKSVKGNASGDFSYSSFFDYTNRDGQLSVWVTWQYYAGGTHGVGGISTWNVDTVTGKPCGTPDFLFRDRASGGKWLTAQLKRKIREQANVYLSDAAQTVDRKNGNYTYYLDGDTLVIVFGSMEIAPYAAGLPTFAFPLKETAVSSPLSVPLSGLSSRGAVRVNGQDALMRNRPVSDGQGGYLLPLEDTCALLGKKITRESGAFSAGGKPVRVTMIGNAPYASLEFFTRTLNELVFYDGSVLRLFPKSA